MAAILDQDEVTYLENRDPNRPLSRYNKIRLLLTKGDQDNSIDPVPVQESWDPPEIPELPSDTFFEVTKAEEHRLDLVSLKVYGTRHLYWIIAYANKMVDPFAESIVGKKLRIPNKENLLQTVLAK